MKRNILGILMLVLLLLNIGCSHHSNLAPAAPATFEATPVTGSGEGFDTAPIAPTAINMRQVATIGETADFDNTVVLKSRLRPPSLIGAEAEENLRAAAQFLPPNPNLRQITSATLVNRAPVNLASFEGPDRTNSSSIPPDPELTAGSDHVISVVNAFFEIHQKNGTVAQAATTFGSFFSGVAGCTGLFDPNVLYDESTGRYILGVDQGGVGYCIAVSQTSDPTGLWNAYRFVTATGGDFFDYPHAGVGEDAIVMGANNFLAGGGVRGVLFAIDKAAMYAGDPLPAPVMRSLGSESTPQPMNLHGFDQGTWPSNGIHYILTDAVFGNGDSIGIWSWVDPLGANTLTNIGPLDLGVPSGVSAGFPVNSPQMGGAPNLQANDWRVQDAEYRNGSVWTDQAISCNPGAGTVNCIRWAEIDPSGPTVVQSGVISSDGEYRTFADLAVDACGNMTIGYSKSSTTSFAGAYVTGRLAADALGTTMAEGTLKAGEGHYSQAANPTRWGDYAGATSDPDGNRTWYLGLYSKTSLGITAPWGHRIGSFSNDCGGIPIFLNGFETGDTSIWSFTMP